MVYHDKIYISIPGGYEIVATELLQSSEIYNEEIPYGKTGDGIDKADNLKW